MLDPRDRALLLECLRPPDGYRLDQAIGTSYSLDLIALLVAPLAFTYFDWEDADGRPVTDPLALLESVRRHADRILIFCQTGEIKLPPPTQRLVAYLEHSVIPVRAPDAKGIFHPKVWLVRFVAEGEPIRYRFLCLSRNLTFDRCWDSILSLDGEVQDRRNAIRANHPLGDFIVSLAGMALQPLPEDRIARISVLAEEVRRVRFDMPPDVDGISFMPLGIPGYSRWPFRAERASRPILVVSPFLSHGLLDRLTEARQGCKLISRPDQLALMSPELLARLAEVFALSPTADDPEDDRDGSEMSSLAGLHAKLFIEDDGRNARVYSGSANATTAAFNRNVEFLVELVGKRARLGIDAFMGREGEKNGIRPLLTRWMGDSTTISEEEKTQLELEAHLVEIRRILAVHPLALRCEPVPDSIGQFRLELSSGTPLPSELHSGLSCWPASLRDDAKRTPGTEAGVIATFGPMALEAVTAFLATTSQAR